MRIGRIVEAELNLKARTPAYKMVIDFGELGTRTCSGQYPATYRAEDLIGKQVVCAMNLGSRRIAGFESQVLMLGAPDTEGSQPIATRDACDRLGILLIVDEVITGFAPGPSPRRRSAWPQPPRRSGARSRQVQQGQAARRCQAGSAGPQARLRGRPGIQSLCGRHPRLRPGRHPRLWRNIPAAQAGRRIITRKMPVGVCAAITPWNFPNAMITRKLAPALAAGCTVVVKPSELTPFSALPLAELGQRAGFPAGVLNIVTGLPEAIGAELTSNPTVRKLTFTGSTKVGKLFLRQCADTVKRVSMELGGNAPVIVFDDADLDQAIAGILASKFRNSGQTCVCANRIYLQDGIYERVAERLTQEVRKLRVGRGTEPGVTIGPLINQAAIRKVETHVSDALAKGATILEGGKAAEQGTQYFQPTVLGVISSAVAPFGGVKESGLGREGSHHGIDEFLEVQALHFEVAAAA